MFFCDAQPDPSATSLTHTPFPSRPPRPPPPPLPTLPSRLPAPRHPPPPSLPRFGKHDHASPPPPPVPDVHLRDNAHPGPLRNTSGSQLFYRPRRLTREGSGGGGGCGPLPGPGPTPGPSGPGGMPRVPSSPSLHPSTPSGLPLLPHSSSSGSLGPGPDHPPQVGMGDDRAGGGKAPLRRSGIGGAGAAGPGPSGGSGPPAHTGGEGLSSASGGGPGALGGSGGSSNASSSSNGSGSGGSNPARGSPLLLGVMPSPTAALAALSLPTSTLPSDLDLLESGGTRPLCVTRRRTLLEQLTLPLALACEVLVSLAKRCPQPLALVVSVLFGRVARVFYVGSLVWAFFCAQSLVPVCALAIGRGCPWRGLGFWVRLCVVVLSGPLPSLILTVRCVGCVCVRVGCVCVRGVWGVGRGGSLPVAAPCPATLCRSPYSLPPSPPFPLAVLALPPAGNFYPTRLPPPSPTPCPITHTEPQHIQPPRYWHRFLFAPPGGVLRRYVLDRVGRVLVVTSGFLTLGMSWIGVVLISASSVLHWSSAVFVFVIVFNSLVTLWFLFGHETLVSSALRTFRHGASLSSVASLVVCVALLVEPFAAAIVASAYPGTLSIATFLKLQTGLGACLGILSRCLGLFVKIRARADEYERRARERKERHRERQQQRKTRFASI
jgi:hypothetical protein